MTTLQPDRVVPYGREPESLHALRLAALPITHGTLRKARIVKNGRFESVVELYHDQTAGSGQYDTESLTRLLGFSSASHPDLGLLRNIARLPTFDIFSVRLLLREMDYALDGEGLTLAPELAAELGGHMRKFTIPLLRYVFGNSSLEAGNMADLFRLFRDPDVARANAHLQRLATKVEIPVKEVPRFLEDYSDTFLAVALYQNSLIKLAPAVDEFIDALETVAAENSSRRNPVRPTIDGVIADFQYIMKMAEKRLQASEQITGLLWGNAEQAKFAQLQPKIREFQFLVGYLLCGLSAKVNAWNTNFFKAASASPGARFDIITTDITPALAHLKNAAAKGFPRRATSMVNAAPTLQSFLRTLETH